MLYIGAYTLDLMINIEVDRRKGGEPKKRVEREWREGMRDGGTGEGRGVVGRDWTGLRDW